MAGDTGNRRYAFDANPGPVKIAEYRTPDDEREPECRCCQIQIATTAIAEQESNQGTDENDLARAREAIIVVVAHGAQDETSIGLSPARHETQIAKPAQHPPPVKQDGFILDAQGFVGQFTHSGVSGEGPLLTRDRNLVYDGLK